MDAHAYTHFASVGIRTYTHVATLRGPSHPHTHIHTRTLSTHIRDEIVTWRAANSGGRETCEPNYFGLTLSERCL